MHSGWSIFIIVITLANVLACWWLLYWAKSKKKDNDSETTGHVWDEDLKEYNNPLPRWWLGLFNITIVFALVYLMLYPGLGNFKGILNWSQAGQYNTELETAEARYGEIFRAYASETVEVLAENPDALKSGHRLFINYCATCHGSDARGAPGFPNLRDNDWLYGNSPEAIKTSIIQGRNGIMPGWGAALGEDGVEEVAAYVKSLSGLPYRLDLAPEGKKKYMQFCAACHGTTGTGNQMLGAPNLADDIWLYRNDLESIKSIIANGAQGGMPAHGDLLSAERIHVLTAYIYALSNPSSADAGSKQQ